jgi:hypothetical protein
MPTVRHRQPPPRSTVPGARLCPPLGAVRQTRIGSNRRGYARADVRSERPWELLFHSLRRSVHVVAALALALDDALRCDLGRLGRRRAVDDSRTGHRQPQRTAVVICIRADPACSHLRCDHYPTIPLAADCCGRAALCSRRTRVVGHLGEDGQLPGRAEPRAEMGNETPHRRRRRQLVWSRAATHTPSPHGNRALRRRSAAIYAVRRRYRPRKKLRTGIGARSTTGLRPPQLWTGNAYSIPGL